MLMYSHDLFRLAKMNHSQIKTNLACIKHTGMKTEGLGEKNFSRQQKGEVSLQAPVLGGASRGDPLKIAIVEDNADLSNLYATILNFHKHVIIYVANNGEDFVRAIKLGRLKDVNVALIDYRLPGLNGLEAARILASTHPNVKIIIATADDLVEKQVSEEGFVLLKKPFSARELIHSLK